MLTWASPLTENLASPSTLTRSLGAVTTSFVSSELSLALSHYAVVVLVHAFVKPTSRIDNYCLILTGIPLGVLWRLERALLSTVGSLGESPKFAPVSNLMRGALHWLPVDQRISYRIAARSSLSLYTWLPPRMW